MCIESTFVGLNGDIDSVIAAKKLKKAWIEKAQIKSKWSREKRKLQEQGVIPVVKKPWEIRDEAEEETRDSDDDGEPSTRPGYDSREESESEAEQPPLKRTKPSSIKQSDLPPHLLRNDSSSSHSAPRQQRPEKSKPKSSWQDEIQNAPSPTKDLKGKSKAHHHRDREEDEGEREKSLRDLKREAYDKKNLHNFRADPLHKHSGRGRFSHTRGLGGGGRGGGPGRGGYRGREPRGQPNMKLRMDYMLEKIKRDYTAPSA